jgi:hypothetical protein
MTLVEGVSIAVAILAIVIGWAVSRKYGNRPAKLKFDWSSELLLTTSGKKRTSDLKVLYKDFEVPDPHLLRITVKNIGSRDIPTSSFDAGRSLRIYADGKLFGLLSVSHIEPSVFPAIGGEIEFSIRPTLIKRGESWEVTAIVAGNLVPKLESPLIDTDIIDTAKTEADVQEALKATRSVLGGLPGHALAEEITKAILRRIGRRS